MGGSQNTNFFGFQGGGSGGGTSPFTWAELTSAVIQPFDVGAGASIMIFDGVALGPDISWDGGSKELTISRAGIYLFEYYVTLRQRNILGVDCYFSMWLEQNGGPIPFNAIMQYFPQLTLTTYALQTIKTHFLVEVHANDVFRFVWAVSDETAYLDNGGNFFPTGPQYDSCYASVIQVA